jgi:hypothetical protein
MEEFEAEQQRKKDKIQPETQIRHKDRVVRPQNLQVKTGSKSTIFPATFDCIKSTIERKLRRSSWRRFGMLSTGQTGFYIKDEQKNEI